MTYKAQADLGNDPTFLGRLGACVTTEARSHDDTLATMVLSGGSAVAASRFLPFITSEPGFDVPEDQITDGMLLAAVQSVWPLVLAVVETPA
jgi:hypothetical protein